MKANIIYLTGFMGTGKSTLGPIIANTLGWEFYDLDKLIEKKHQKTVVEIFREKGEDFFRKVETELLTELSTKTKVIISLGGGTIASGNNLEIMKKTGKIIYLKSLPEKIFQRLKYKTDRPAFQTFDGEPMEDNEMLAKINELMSQREKFYEQADYIFCVDNVNVGKTVDELVKVIKLKF